MSCEARIRGTFRSQGASPPPFPLHSFRAAAQRAGGEDDRGAMRQTLLGTSHLSGLSAIVGFKPSDTDKIVQGRRQEAIGNFPVGSIRNGTDVGTRPGEAVRFGENDPGTIAIETEASLGGCRNLHAQAMIVGCAMSYGQDRDNSAARSRHRGKQNGARPVLGALLCPGSRLVAP